MKLCDLSDIEFTKLLDKATVWYSEHTQYVDKLIKSDKYSYYPTSSDMFHPELWKSGHWKWYKERLKDRV